MDDLSYILACTQLLFPSKILFFKLCLCYIHSDTITTISPHSADIVYVKNDLLFGFGPNWFEMIWKRFRNRNCLMWSNAVIAFDECPLRWFWYLLYLNYLTLLFAMHCYLFSQHNSMTSSLIKALSWDFPQDYLHLHMSYSCWRVYYSRVFACYV